MRSLFVLCQLLCSSGSALALTLPAVSRRGLTAAISTLALGAPADAQSQANEARKLDDRVRVLASKAKSLRSYVRNTSSNRRTYPMALE